MIRDVFGHARSYCIVKDNLHLVALLILLIFVILYVLCRLLCRSVLFVLCTCALSLSCLI
jgi:predicted RND superfamily exporter protein